MSEYNNFCGCPQCLAGISRGESFSSSASGPTAATSGTYYIDALLAESGTTHWNAVIGQSVSVSYSFLTSLPAAYAGTDEANGFAVFNSTQEAAARSTLALWSEVANISFTETTGSLGQIRFATATLPSAAGAWAYYPGTGTGGDVWISNYYESNATPAVGNYAYSTFIHEIGHALGLKHPGNYNALGGGTDGPYLPSAEDNNQYSVMSYNDHPSVTAVREMTPMLYDIAAIQYLYGVNTATRSGDTTYSWGVNEAVMKTLWDGGGTDTIDVSNQTAAQTVDLRAGGFSSVAGQTNNIAVAYGAVIENAVGGSGADRLIGNSAANRLDGGAGADTLEGGAGDTLVGGSGSDTVSLDSGGGSVVLNGVETLIGGSGADTVTLESANSAGLVLRDIETLIGSSGGDLVIYGNRGVTMTVSGVETLVGGAGTDIVSLGAGGVSIVLRDVETVVGGTGVDTVVLGARGVTATMARVENILGSAASDFITVGPAGITATFTNIDIIRGGSGTDIVTLGGASSSVLVVALESIVGTSGGDFVTLGNLGSTTRVSGVETLRGGVGADVMTLSDSGNTVVLVLIETLVGGSGTDVVLLGGLGSTMTVSGVETIRGGGSVENVTISGSVYFRGGGGADVATLQSGGGTDSVVLADSSDGGAAGATSGYDTARNFQSGTDRLLLTDSLKSLLDDNGDGVLTVAGRGTGTANAGTDEAVVLSGTVSSLTDTDFAAFRSALGSVSGSAADQELLVLVSDGTSSGAYLALDTDGDGAFGAADIRLLAVFSGATLTTADLAFG